ncbi:MAG: SDR family NAD(P)-dependent oxidoreductase [Alphaproteobacteria bacterium]|nr:SDR family NAD(P)-dependent oxidoreductase [Alphaproteobacteria bacterium]
MTIRFDGRCAIVTGAGHGRCHARALAARGARVVINDLGAAVDGSGESRSAADAVVEEIRALGGEAVASYGSVSDAAAAAAIVATAEEAFGGVDILVNNAGILRDKSFAKVSLEDFRRVLAVHFLGSVYVTRAAFPIMKAQRYGRIVMTTSAAGLYGSFGQTNYGAAKMALIGLMNCLKLEGAKHNVLVNAIAPVATTRMTAELLPEALRPLLRPEFATAAVAYLCSEQCTASGDVIQAGAGYYAKVQVVEARGARFGADAEVTPEMVAGAYGEITDMAAARPFANAGEALQGVFGGA